MKDRLNSLKSRSILWVIMSMLAGIISAYIWSYSGTQWERHLNRSYIAGIVLFENIKMGEQPPQQIEIESLSGQISKLADAGLFRKLPDVAVSDFITQLSLSPGVGNIRNKNSISIALISPDIQYPLANLKINSSTSLSEKFGDVTRMLSSYCSEPILYMQYGDKPWIRVDGNEIWGCDAAPTDYRIISMLLVFLSLIILISFILNTSLAFQSFAELLSKRGLNKRTGHFQIKGPAELRSMIETINNYLDIEQESLARRATFLSGVSHDLGTPATRLKFRAQTIEDKELKERLNSDIDQMTSMIESVLQYTQSEMKLEELRQISLQSLIEAIVSDFQDANHPVKFVEQESLSVSAKTILFNSKPKLLKSKFLSGKNVIIFARPLSMQRAIINLIDNALKYGRKANVSLQADSQKASIIIYDYGNSESVENLTHLTVPFKRGENAKNIKGMGIGLAIVSTIAEQHGGNLSFDKWEQGLCAILSIPR